MRSLPCSPSYRLWLLPCVASRGIAQPLPPVPYLPALAVGEGRGLLFMSGRPKHSPDCSVPCADGRAYHSVQNLCWLRGEASSDWGRTLTRPVGVSLGNQQCSDLFQFGKCSLKTCLLSGFPMNTAVWLSNESLRTVACHSNQRERVPASCDYALF